MNLEAPRFSSPCLARTPSSWIPFTPRIRTESSMNTPSEIFLVNRLAQVADDSVRQGTGPVKTIGVGSNEDCRNREPRFDEVSVEFAPGHPRHMDVSDQAGRFHETM